MRLTNQTVNQLIIIETIRGCIMDIVLIKTFLEIEDCRHFVKAPENLHLTQASIITRIAMK